jgi:RNA polymerase sigma-70 factor (ECF subfamily)
MEISLDYAFAGRAGEAAPDEQRDAVTPSGRDRFEEILRRHHAMLRRVAAGVLVETDSLDDVLQEAYLKAYRNLPRRFANEAHEASWLYRVVYRCCLDELRRRKRRREQPLDDAPAAQRDALTTLEITQALAAVSPEDRALLLLVDLLGFGYETAAGVLGVPRGTVASRLHTARARFKRLLGDD